MADFGYQKQRDFIHTPKAGYHLRVLEGVSVFCDHDTYPTKVEISQTNRKCFYMAVETYLKSPLHQRAITLS